MDIRFMNFLSLHILPDHFVRIRHYGILSPCSHAKPTSIPIDITHAAEVQHIASYLLRRDEAYIVLTGSIERKMADGI